VGPSFTGPIHEIAANIEQSSLQLSALPRSHPLRPIWTYSLARALSHRYQLLNQKDDLDKSILYFTESLLLSPLSWLAHGQAILGVLSQLALSLANRSRVSRKPEDAIYAAKYFRHLRDPARTPFAFQRQTVTVLLVQTLAFLMELKASDAVQTLEEMAVLTHELLSSDPSSDNSASASAWFTITVAFRLPDPSPDRLLNQIIECLRLVRKHKPESRGVQFCLVKCLTARFETSLNDELDEVVSIVDEMIASSSPGDEVTAKFQDIVPVLAIVRSLTDGSQENSEEAIYRARAFLASSSPEEALYPTWSHILRNAANNRFKNFGPIDGLEASSSDPLLPPKTRPLDRLLDGIRNNSITDIEEGIDLGRSILASSDPSDLQSSHEFSDILFEAFKRTKNINYLNESIHTHHQLLAGRPPMILRHQMTAGLFGPLYARSLISPSHRTQDLKEIVELFPQVYDGTEFLSLPDRFHAACIWANFAQGTQHPSASTAYETALSLMQEISPFSPTLQLQHTTLTTLPAYAHEMPLAYASYQVERGQLEQAIETLERGRTLLWSEMRHLRTSIDQLLDADPELGYKFAALNGDLEELTKSIAPSHKLNMDDVVADDLRAGDQFGSFLLRQRGLLKERDKLISQIRALPGFHRFLKFPLFDTLRSAATAGPVIIINHAIRRSDILILLHNASLSLIPTPDDFYDRANALKDKLLVSRANDGLDSRKYDETLASVLAELYKLVGEPVIERLRQLHVPEQSRIWWCPTSVFCYLPIHAMGPIPSDDGEPCYFLDLYICSYTPSLSALIQSRIRDSDLQPSGRPSVLLVAQINPSLPTVGGEIQVVRGLDTKVTSLISGAATPASVTNSFQHHQFVHFACHGTLEPGKPFESGFELHGDERLTLLDIVRSNLPTAEFAFLSACHTAEMTEGSIMDEGLHLAAAVQYSGFRSVVGTMWAMVDEDGRDLAENFYKALFSNSRSDQEIPYHERSAKALRFAVKKLRRKRWITLERWVNFVHYGA
jgi:CHAT domain-containing protein